MKETINGVTYDTDYADLIEVFEPWSKFEKEWFRYSMYALKGSYLAKQDKYVLKAPYLFMLIERTPTSSVFGSSKFKSIVGKEIVPISYTEANAFIHTYLNDNQIFRANMRLDQIYEQNRSISTQVHLYLNNDTVGLLDDLAKEHHCTRANLMQQLIHSAYTHQDAVPSTGNGLDGINISISKESKKELKELADMKNMTVSETMSWLARIPELLND